MKKIIIFFYICIPLIATARKPDFSKAWWKQKGCLVFYPEDLRQQYQIPVFSKKQMYKDFDAFVKIMKHCNPQYEVRKQATGYDMIENIRVTRSHIDTITNITSFVNLLNDIMFLSKDEHCYSDPIALLYFCEDYRNDTRFLKPSNRDLGWNFHYRKLRHQLNKNYNYLYVKYIKGNYYTLFPVTVYHGNDSTLLHAMSKMIAINDLPASSFSRADNPYAKKYDFEHETYYTDYFRFLKGKKRLLIEHDGREKMLVCDSLKTNIPSWDMPGNRKHEVHYLDNDSLLYIRLPHMNISMVRDIKDSIFVFKNKPVKAVIVDIRGNEGGNDDAWHQLVSSLSGTTLSFPIISVSTPDYYMVKKRFGCKGKREVTFPFLHETRKYYKLYMDSTFCISPDTINLNYNGIIYVLIDEDIASSAGVFASLSTKTNRVKTVGMPTGQLHGAGPTPSFFMLPESRLLFQIDLVLDAVNVHSAIDFYHDKPTYPVKPSLNYYKWYYTRDHTRGMNIEEMYEKDDVFRETLKIIKNESR